MNVDINTMLLALQDPQTYAHKTEKIELIETHISWVILTGMYAYKIKKPVNMGFLDFSTLAKRKHYCELELVLNKRLAADYYLEVVPVTGSYQQPTLGGGEEVIEYALKMRQFPKDAELDIKLASGVLDKSMMELLAEKIAAFHQQINVADDASSFGDLLHVHQPVLNSYAEILKHVKDEAVIACLNSLKNWSCNEYERLKEIFLSRKNDGFVRECHGDLHLRNIAIVGDEVIAFDCIEFNEDLRWNDVISEIAFVCMDLDDHHCPELASRFLNHYLALTGDYAGLKVFNYYLVYRATVRAMVSCIRLKQEILTASESENEYNNFLNYLALAQRYTTTRTPCLFIMHGFSGSGKSTVSQMLMDAYPAIRLRSDVERKRLHGLKALQREQENYQQGIYSAYASEKTYQALLKFSQELLQAGFSVIVDAAFLNRGHRERFRTLAESLNVDYRIVHCKAAIATLQKRVEQRFRTERDASDADIAVLAKQMEDNDAFSKNEEAYVVEINTESGLSLKTILAGIGMIDKCLAAVDCQFPDKLLDQ